MDVLRELDKVPLLSLTADLSQCPLTVLQRTNPLRPIKHFPIDVRLFKATPVKL